MNPTKSFHIVAWLTLFSIAFTVNTIGTDAREDNGIATYSSPGPTRSHRTDGNGFVIGDGILLGDYMMTSDGVVLGDSSIFCSNILHSEGVVRGKVLGDGVVLGDGFVPDEAFSIAVGKA